MEVKYIIIITIIVIVIIINLYKISNEIQNQTSTSYVPSLTIVSPSTILTPPSTNNILTPSSTIISPSSIVNTPSTIISPSSIVKTPSTIISPSIVPVINIPPSINQFWSPLSTPSYTPSSSFKLPYNIPDIEIYDDVKYRAVIIRNINYTNIISRVKVFCGKNIVMVIDKDNIGTELNYTLTNGSVINPIISLQSTNKTIYYYAMAMVVDNLDKLIDQFVLTINRNPSSNLYKNKSIRVEIAFLNASGLAFHGIAGIAVGPAFLINFFNSCMKKLENAANIIKIEQIFTYEFSRNYIFPDTFFPILNYNVYNYLDRNNSNKNAITYDYNYTTCVSQGFVNILGGFLTLNFNPPIGYNYSGYDLPGMFAKMEYHLNMYINGNYKWDDVFMYDRLIWNTDESLDNLYSGLLIHLWKNYNTNNMFLIRFFKAINLMIPNRHPQNFQYSSNISSPTNDGSTQDPIANLRLNSQTASENFYIASSYAAKQDLYTYFTVTLRRSIRLEARDYAINLINNNP